MVWVFVNFFLYCCSWLVPRSRKLAVFGSWCGKQFSDNPKYLLQYVLEHEDCDCVWIGNPEIEQRLPKHPRLRFARFGSFKANWAALRAKNWFFSQGCQLDISPWFVFGGARMYNLWHGIAFKYMGLRAASRRTCEKTDVFHRAWRWVLDHGLSPKSPYWMTTASDSMTEILCSCAPQWFSSARTLRCGTPRNEFLIRNRDNAELVAALKRKYATLLGFDPSKKVVLYMPTFRGGAGARVGLGSIVDGLDAVLLEKHHPITFARQQTDFPSAAGSILVTPEQSDLIDNPELYLITDIMIGDYSSAFFDFSLLKRPVVHYVYDLEEYMTKDAGLAYDIRKIAGGPLVRTEEELRETVRRLLADPKCEPGPDLEGLLVYERGDTCRQICVHCWGAK